jgi:hypothetical protein
MNPIYTIAPQYCSLHGGKENAQEQPPYWDGSVQLLGAELSILCRASKPSVTAYRLGGPGPDCL